QQRRHELRPSGFPRPWPGSTSRLQEPPPPPAPVHRRRIRRLRRRHHARRAPTPLTPSTMYAQGRRQGRDNNRGLANGPKSRDKDQDPTIRLNIGGNLSATLGFEPGGHTLSHLPPRRDELSKPTC